MRKGGSIRRNRPSRQENKKLLIVTEGEITEVQYLQGLIQHLRSAGVTVVPRALHAGGGEPSRVLAKARDLAAQGDYEAVWLVVDDDDHAALDDVLRQCVTAHELVVVTNPQFEAWLLWHFTEKENGTKKTTASLSKELQRHGVTGKHLPANFPFAGVDQAASIASHKSRWSDQGADSTHRARRVSRPAPPDAPASRRPRARPPGRPRDSARSS